MRLRRALGMAVLALGLTGGCDAGEGGGSGGRTTEPGRGHGIKLVKQRAKPTEAPATRYGAAVDHQLTEVEQALAAAVQPAGMAHEPAISAMARQLATIAPDHLNMPPALVDGLLAWFGLVDPPPRLVVVEIPSDSHGCDETATGPCAEPLQAIAEEVIKTANAEPGAAFGVAAVGLENGNTRMMVAIVNRMVEMTQLPATVAVGESVAISGKLLGNRNQPRMEVVDARGGWQQVPTVSGNDGSFDAKLSCDRGKGVYQVELLANGQHGPEVAANFPLYCGVPRAGAIAYEIERIGPGVSASDVAQANFEYLNAAREVRGLPPLQWDDRAAGIALAHSEDMYRSGFVGHVSPSTGDVTDRFVRAKVQGAVIRENVARGYGPKGMHESLMSSPGHRINIVASDVTHVGIGVVVGDAETSAAGAPRPMFLTQNFYKKPGAGAPKDLPKATRKSVDGLRKGSGLRPLRWDDRLSKLAQRKAEALAKGRQGVSEAEFQEQVFGLGYVSLARHQVTSSDHDALARLEEWKKFSEKDFIGLGIARVPGKGDEAGGFLLIIVVAEK